MPRPSATVVVVRDSNHGPELLLVKRRAGAAFGDAYTFPGGVLDDDEYHAREFCAGLGAGQADSLLSLEDGGLDFFSAAVRELFEETGVLLASGDLAGIDDLRQGLNNSTMTWPGVLQQNELTVSCDALHYFAHWITPSAQPQRWSTRFFLAQMPDGQNAFPDGREVTEALWLTASVALESDLNLPFPTRRTLKSVAGLQTVEDLFHWARQQQVRGIPAIQPEMIIENGKPRIIMPD